MFVNFFKKKKVILNLAYMQQSHINHQYFLDSFANIFFNDQSYPDKYLSAKTFSINGNIFLQKGEVLHLMYHVLA